MLAIGMTLLTACNSPTIKESQPSCVISLRLGTFNCGPRVLDYKRDREIVGEWENLKYNIYGNLSEIQDGSALEKCNNALLDIQQRIANGEQGLSEELAIAQYRIKLLNNANELVSFTTESWLLKIKPTMKEGHDFYIDYKR